MTTTETTEAPGISVLPAPSIQLARSLASTPLEDLSSMSPYLLFQKQMESGSTEASLDAMKRLSVVAITMGQAEVQSEMIPYLTTMVTQPSGVMAQPQGSTSNIHPPTDELLLLLGQELKLVGRFYMSSEDKKYAVEDFLPILERLAAVEETVVRDEAVSVFAEFSDSALASQSSTWMALIKRLVNADWFTPKVSAAGIIPHLFSIVTDKNNGANAAPNGSLHPAALELLALYKELCTDETPMVRRAAAQHLGHALAQSGWIYRDDGLAVATFTRLCHDEQDSVRRLAVVALADASTLYAEQSPQWTAQHWLPLLKEASTDLSWRVRHNLSKNFSSVAENVGVNKDRRLITEQALVMACFVTLLTDVEAEVRAAAVAHLARMVAWGGQSHFTTHLQPLLPALADDVVMEVRSKCALALMDAAHGGTLEDAVILQSFGPLLEAFLQDEFHEVQLQVLTNLHKIAHLLQGLGGVVTTLLQMSKATNWRVRQAVAQLLPHLAEARGMEFFTQVLMEPAWLTLLMDPVASVRQAIMEGMPLLVKVAGDDWITQNLMPHHVKIYNQSSSSYLMRITLLQGFIEAAPTAKGSLLQEVIGLVVKALTQDKVANVRMVAAKGLEQIVTSESFDDDGLVQGQIKPALTQKLGSEDDEDVRFACQSALDHIK
uniref:TOG domain-containing protein n=1 Tax=Entomoneis paludosa TaxID=265537 RepID=A0A7S2VDL9_9STRA|mmetsp:Transcript_18273/g.37785  ORF Transcript_18273/g.37785 Transcript_18273/m.37785 type:complete len:662 (+) Transcript_18273:346-2331(+)|eukprot:CAMPEP_0172449890 /NCGR_PEP_ID=MMETSP1065-20121228/8468_1 /TAXON_ID=265537 /ORGANISM="Amphiprora paludosa, Strain CCMP125" /LENGTH=661 /DNA_ID=CAMNT_0013201647 /DNA_START=309 /DNA_END=2294 /DNA_ORIENTATION=-